MKTYLNSSILYFPCSCRIKYSDGNIIFFKLLSKLRMVSCITLNAYTPTLLGHAKHEGPTFFWIQICIRQNKQTLIRFKL